MSKPQDDVILGEMLAALRADSVVAPASARARVARKLAKSTGLAALAQAAPDRLVPEALETASGGASATSAGAGIFGGALALHPVGLLVSFLLGGGVGAGVYASVRPAQVVYVERPAPVVVAAPVVSPATSAPSRLRELEPIPAPKGASPTSSVAPRVLKKTAGTAREKSSEGLRVSAILAEQQALLDEARAALGRGNSIEALAALAAHSRRFPSSLLGEERDALVVKALIVQGELDSARRELAQFEAKYPGSLMLTTLKQLVGSNQ